MRINKEKRENSFVNSKPRRHVQLLQWVSAPPMKRCSTVCAVTGKNNGVKTFLILADRRKTLESLNVFLLTDSVSIGNTFLNTSTVRYIYIILLV